MKSPLAVVKEVEKELGVEDKYATPPYKKIGYLQEQLDQLQTMVWRSIVDVVHAKRLQESDVVALRNKGLERESTHKNEVEQFYGGIKMVKQLIDELRKEYPELSVED